ncbi:hypothetical protein QN277_003922 [Acacia crassicarpa]|uniref:Uncharacterized protein n=1 Tax=Acacia crassicarpa TaxID=499986 RepID=A0AAE1MG41_9FABA|nr:hypothetical protein QN277_003922 [Acacia crassicarpa]
MMSTGEKRKLHANDDRHNQKKLRDGLVNDDEVEEFYTILRRINTAAQYFKSGSDRNNGTAAASHRGWRESLEEEIKRQVNSVKEDTIDLNLSPGPE